MFHHDLFPLRKSWFLSIGIRALFETRLEVLFVLSFLICYGKRVICVGLKRLNFENARDNGCSCYMNMHMFIDVNMQFFVFLNSTKIGMMGVLYYNIILHIRMLMAAVFIKCFYYNIILHIRMLMAAVFIKFFNYNIVLLNASNYRKSRVIMVAIF